MSNVKSLAALLIAALCATSSQAANQIDQVQLNCTDALSIEGTSALSVRCTGDLSAIGLNGQGSIQADESLSFWAKGSLSFQDVWLVAPNVSLSSDTSIAMNSGSSLNGSPVVTLRVPADRTDLRGIGVGTAGSIELSSAGPIAFGTVSAVPEPTTGMLSLTALALGGLLQLVRRTRQA